MVEGKAGSPDPEVEKLVGDADKCLKEYRRCLGENPSSSRKAFCKMQLIACLLKPEMANIDAPGDGSGDASK